MSPNTDAVSHAGGVVYRRRSGTIEFLLVRSKTRACRVLPKGHIEPGEKAPAAAAREVLEESGYALEPGERLGVFAYDTPGSRVVTVYYLMEAAPGVRPGPLDEPFRNPRWFTIEEAQSADLPLPDGVREVLERAQRALAAGGS